MLVYFYYPQASLNYLAALFVLINTYYKHILHVLYNYNTVINTFHTEKSPFSENKTFTAELHQSSKISQ